MKQYLSLIRHKPKQVFCVTFTFLVLLSLGTLSLSSNFGIKFWFKTEDPHLGILSNFEKQFGEDNNVVVVVHNPDGIITKEGILLIKETTDKLSQTISIAQVLSLTNYPIIQTEEDDLYFDQIERKSKNPHDFKKLVLNSPEIFGQFIDKDMTTALVVARLTPHFEKIPNYKKIISEARSHIDELKLKNPDFKIYMTGVATVVDQFRQYAYSDLLLVLPLLSIGILLLMYYAFRNIIVSFIPFTIFSLSTLAAFGFAGFAGFPFHNVSAVIPGILVTMAFADTMHILNTYRHQILEGEKREAAVFHSAKENFIPTLLTTLTTAIGLFSFLSAKLDPLKQIGLIAGVGTLILWIATFGLLVPLMRIYPPKLKSVNRTVFDRISTRVPKKLIYVFFSIFILLSIHFMSRLEVNTNPIGYFPDDSELALSKSTIERTIGGVPGAEIIIDSLEDEGVWKPEFVSKVIELEKELLKNKVIVGVKGPFSLLRKMNMALRNTRKLPKTKEELAELYFLGDLNSPENFKMSEYVTVDKRKLRFTIFWNITDSRSALSAMKEIEKIGKNLGLKVNVTGKFVLYYLMTDYVFKTFLYSLTISLSMVFIIFLILMKDLRLALLAMLPNIIPIMIGLGTLGFLNVPIDTTICMAASVCLGLAVDDTIHLIYKYREGGESAFKEVIPTLTLTSTSLMIGFSLFYFSSFRPNSVFGILCAWIITWALLTDIYLLPLLLKASEEKLEQDLDDERKHYRPDSSLAH